MSQSFLGLVEEIFAYFKPRRMHAVDQNEETSCEIFFKYFRENKVEIADAITKPFPFLESLRDRSFITDKIYTESLDWSLMQTLFSRVHLKEYPGLTEIHRSFENVLQEKYFSQKTNRKEKQKTFNTQQSCEKGN